MFLISVESRSANERLFRSLSSEECEDSTSATTEDSNINNRDNNNNKSGSSSSNAGTSKSGTTPIPVIYE